MRISAHAKINLNLRVLSKRADGYHEVETLMAPLALHDDVEISPSKQSGLSVTCDVPWVPCDESNLAYRAAQEFFAVTGQTGGAKIHLTKRIPAGAGLGGGSSNAAAVLVALNQLFRAGLPDDQLEELSTRIGSDVPWFICSKPAICRGRGEKLEPVVLNHSPKLLLLKPPFGVPTPWAYKAWGEIDPQCPGDAQDTGWVKIFNDLEPPVFNKYVLLPAMKSWLRSRPGVTAAAMSGSGSTMFALLSGEAGSLANEARAVFGASLWTCPTKLLGTGDLHKAGEFYRASGEETVIDGGGE